MLFHIKQVHTPENCPYGKGGSPSLRDESVSEVDLKAAYGAFMEHTVYMVVETDDLEKLNEFLHPGMKICTTTITPVSAEPLPRWNAWLADPTVGQIAALAAIFGVEPSYLVDRKGQPVLGGEVLDALADETAAAILRECARLPEREKRTVLGVVREFGEGR